MTTPSSSESPSAPTVSAVIVTLRLSIPEPQDDQTPPSLGRLVRELPPVSQLQRYLDLSG